MNETLQIFIISIGTIGVGFLALVVRTIYKSKCNRFICGCIEIDRDVGAENFHDGRSVNNDEDKV